MLLSLQRLQLLLWKNWRLQWHHRWRNFAMLLISTLLLLIFPILRTQFTATTHPADIYPPFCVFSVPGKCEDEKIVPTFKNKHLAYTPKNPYLLGEMVRKFETIFKSVIGFDSQTQLEHHLASDEGKDTLAGIQFDDDIKGATIFPKTINIALRFPGELRENPDKTWMIESAISTSQIPYEHESLTGGDPNYYKEGYLSLQMAIASYLMNATPSELPIIRMQRYPHSPWVDDKLSFILTVSLPMVIFGIFAYPGVYLVLLIVSEKTCGLKEYMKIMGVTKLLLWTSWFIMGFIYFFTFVIIIMLIFTVPWGKTAFFAFSNPLLLFIFLLLYISCLTTFFFMASSIAHSVSSVMILVSILLLINMVPMIVSTATKFPTWAKIPCSLLPNAALFFGMEVFIKLELYQIGVTNANLWYSDISTDIPIGIISLMLLIGCILYLILALYIEALFPGKYGIPMKWSCIPKRPTIAPIEEEKTDAIDEQYFEKEPTNIKPGIEIKNLSKKFKKAEAVKKVKLNIYDGQITALLGSNGAGKTTLISMLIGIIPPTHGTALINGYDLVTQMDSIRTNIGICPQHNVLFDELTIKEHIYFFGRLKGLSQSKIKIEIEKYINTFNFQNNANVESSKLSGGIKRILCLAMALCGSPKIVILDEPTSGLDPETRRSVWEFLQEQKQGRCMILSTHFMDEADILGDRITIMTHGQLRCCGSSLFLKKKYGAGYQLIINKLPGCNPDLVAALLRRHIPDVKLDSNIGSELCYLLLSANSSKFESLLQDLEQNKGNLKISGYGISITTLEEVFLKVVNSQIDEQTSKQHAKLDEKVQIVVGNSTNVDIDNIKLTSGFELKMNQYQAMGKKLYKCVKWLDYIIVIGIVLLFIIFCVKKPVEQEPNTTLLNINDDDTILISPRRTNKLVNIYQKCIDANIEFVDNISSRILNLTKRNPALVRAKYPFGVSFDDNSIITAWFNGEHFHSATLSLGSILQTLYTHLTSDGSINFENIPMPLKPKFQVSAKESPGKSLIILIVLPIFIANHIPLGLAKERILGFKQIQLVSGLPVYIFWTSAFMFYFLLHILLGCCMIIPLAVKNIDGYTTSDGLVPLTVLFLLFGCSAIPVGFLLSYIGGESASQYILLLLNLLGVGGAFAVYFIPMETVQNILFYVFGFVPTFLYCSGLLQMSTKFQMNRICQAAVKFCIDHQARNEDQCEKSTCKSISQCCNVDETYFKFSKPNIGQNVMFYIITSAVYFALLLAIDNKYFRMWSNRSLTKTQTMTSSQTKENEDVQAENKLIQNTPIAELSKEYVIILKNLTKRYKKFVAVDNVCLGIKPFECFGLLGVNGAGKTTTFKMLTGEVNLSSGEIWIMGFNPMRDYLRISNLVGYCPQFDQFLGNMTTMEIIYMFCLIRGIPKQHCLSVCNTLAELLNFSEHIKKKFSTLSGGNKRKVSTAVAVIGNPPIIYLDEPTTGMDPVSKRHIWNFIMRLRNLGKCIILTTHSMEECEALCTRVAIMVGGKYRCLGPIQYLKTKYAEYCSLVIKAKRGISDSELTTIENYIKRNFPGAVLKEKFQEMLTYEIPAKAMAWSRMFGIMEKSKKELNIDDYSLAQYSLEQIFISFCK